VSTWSSSEIIEVQYDFKNLPHGGPIGGRLGSKFDSPTEKWGIMGFFFVFGMDFSGELVWMNTFFAKKKSQLKIRFSN